MIRSFINNNIANIWIKNAVLALGFAGIYSIFLVLLRTPVLSSFIEDKNIFKKALVVHVNLSVLVWLLSIICAVSSNNIKNIFIGKVCALLSVVSTFLITVSIFCNTSIVIMNNYIPMLENIIFIIGLSLFLTSVLIFQVTVFSESIIKYFDKKHLNSNEVLLDIYTFSTSIIYIITCICFILSYHELSTVISNITIDVELYYELLFWSSGHILQFIFCQALIAIFVLLVSVLLDYTPRYVKIYSSLLKINSIFACCCILGHFVYDIITPEFKEFYTIHMRYFGGIVTFIVLISVLYEILYYTKYESYIVTAILCASIVFTFGCIIGIFITEINVSIPAHYHGSIVGITIGFMGFVYLLLDNSKPNLRINKFLATFQLYLISAGQILHIVGLAIAGGYNVMRKTPYSELNLNAKIALSMVGIGGLIAILGGLIFVYIVFSYYYKNKSSYQKRYYLL